MSEPDGETEEEPNKEDMVVNEFCKMEMVGVLSSMELAMAADRLKSLINNPGHQREWNDVD
jgi:mannose/cellobiose epimerase-like protein (N-acyl-D-glucosamine 2-epimerase family)